MYRDTLILLILKGIFKDTYLVNHLYNLVLNDEINEMLLIHEKKSINYKEDIQLLYPGLLRTAFFENIRFNTEDDIDPGYSFYAIQPLTDCGTKIYYENDGFRYDISEINNHKNTSGIVLLNNMRKKYSLTQFGKMQMEIILHKRNIYADHELYNKSKISLWYDFENKIFTE